MSLILEALRKLEREKETPDRGLVVVAAPPWEAPRARVWAVPLAAAAIGAAVAVVAVRPRVTPPAPPAVSVAPAAAPVTAPVGPATTLPRAAAPRGRPAPAAPLAEPARATAPRAPAAAAAAPAPADPPLLLQAITVREGRPIAVVNERVVEEGDVVDGARVVRIGDGEVEVEIERDGRRRILRF